jgi:hypothetical protein
MIRLIDGVRQTTNFLTTHGLLLPYERTGRYRPQMINSRPFLQREQMEALQKAELRGELYQSRHHWQMYYEITRSFLQRRRQGTACIFDGMFGELAAPLQDVADVLPSAMALQNFQLINAAKSSRQFLFRASEQCSVEDLPEPYGNWLQHNKLDPRWQKNEQLDLSMLIKLSSPKAGATRLHIESSTFAIANVVRLGWGLNEELALTPKAEVGIRYLQKEVRFLIGGREVDLSILN